MAFQSKRMENHEANCLVLNGSKPRPLESDKQKLLEIPTISKEEKGILDALFAAVCYEEGLPFTTFEKPAMQRALHRLNPAYTPPTRRPIGEKLLDNAYDSVKAKVDAHLNTLSQLNIITDESSNINHSRIANISIHTADGSFHWLSEDIGALQSNAINVADWLEQHLLKLTNGNLQRISSLATDTCATMIAMWREIRTKPSLRHILVIPCDSHGIQLLTQDLIKSIPAFSKVHDDAQSIAKAFKNSPIQYARLHDIQEEVYKKKYAMVLAVITRWGTELGLYHGLARSKEALQTYAFRWNGAKDMPQNIIDIILSQEFWNNLNTIREILAPINAHLKNSEHNDSTIGKVLPRWDAICTHLERMSILYPIPGFAEFLSKERDQISGKPKGVFLRRYILSIIY
jgi:hypothetical protein